LYKLLVSYLFASACILYQTKFTAATTLIEHLYHDFFRI